MDNTLTLTGVIFVIVIIIAFGIAWVIDSETEKAYELGKESCLDNENLCDCDELRSVTYENLTFNFTPRWKQYAFNLSYCRNVVCII